MLQNEIKKRDEAIERSEISSSVYNFNDESRDESIVMNREEESPSK